MSKAADSAYDWVRLRPRSGRAVRVADQECHAGVVLVDLPSDDALRELIGRDLLASADLEQVALACLADVGGLRSQYIGERGAAFQCDGHAVDVAGEWCECGPLRHAVESLDGPRAGPGFGQRPAQLIGELTAADPGHSFERAE